MVYYGLRGIFCYIEIVGCARLKRVRSNIKRVRCATVIRSRKRDSGCFCRGDSNIHIFFKNSLDSVHITAFQEEINHHVEIA